MQKDDKLLTMIFDLPFYNILLNIEEICIESENIELTYCSLATKNLIQFYLDLYKEQKRDFVFLKDQIENELAKMDLYVLLEILQDNNILGDWVALYQRMYGRLEYLTIKYESSDN